MNARFHAAAGLVAMACILSFWASTLVSELLFSVEVIAAVKHGILYAMALLVPAMVAAGAGGFMLSRNRSGSLLAAKKRRMRLVALNGLLVLLPSAIYLYGKARMGELDALFYVVQTVELLAGAINFTLLGLNARDGLKLSGRFRSFGLRS
jgi:uncharacterized membrane protein